MHLFRGLGGYCYFWSGSCSLQHSGFWRDALDWHGFRDRGLPRLVFLSSQDMRRQYPGATITT
jgi:hypothetical protein